MRKKSFWLVISALLLFVLVLVACGFSSNTANNKPSRFVSEDVYVDYCFDYSFIITDTQTGTQYLYLYQDTAHEGGPFVVKLDSIVEPTYNVE